jgi:hypothetical protein
MYKVYKTEIAFFIILILLISFVLFGPIPPIGALGSGDFHAYWSASYLLSHGKDFADPDLLFETEKTLTGWSNSFTLLTWNPPWLLVVLLPYTIVSFERGKWLWLLTNIVIVFAGSLWAWLSCVQTEKGRQFLWLAPVIAFSLSATLLAFIMGQVSGLVFWGLAGFLFWQHRKAPVISGIFLVFTLVKPHLVYITVPLILLAMLHQRQWRFFAGFLGSLAALTAVVFALRPSFLISYVQTVGGGNLLYYESPTLGGILDFAFGWHFSKFIGVLILPLALFLWWRFRKQIDLYTLTAVATLFSIITVPFGWSYDAIVLLIPLFQIALWLIEGSFSRQRIVFFASLLVVLNVLTFVRRVRTVNEVYYFWLPIAVATVYLLVHRLKRQAIEDSLLPDVMLSQDI